MHDILYLHECSNVISSPYYLSALFFSSRQYFSCTGSITLSFAKWRANIILSRQRICFFPFIILPILFLLLYIFKVSLISISCLLHSLPNDMLDLLFLFHFTLSWSVANTPGCTNQDSIFCSDSQWPADPVAGPAHSGWMMNGYLGKRGEC